MRRPDSEYCNRHWPFSLVSLVLCLFAILPATPVSAQNDNPCQRPEARQFDFWIGEWDVLNLGRRPETEMAETGRATVKVYPILDGCAIVEHWEGRANFRSVIGFSVRAFDPASGKWHLVLNWPGQDRPSFGTLEGEFRHGRGEFFAEYTNREGEDVKVRYSFSDAGPNTMRWDSASSKDGGVNWFTNWIMEKTRRNPDLDDPLLNGPWIAGTPARCTFPEARQLDDMNGSWQGTETLTAADGSSTERAYRTTIWPIVGGCALMELATGGEGEDALERFAVRSYLPQKQGWEEYALDSRDPIFAHTEGKWSDDGLSLTTVSGEETTQQQRRVRWKVSEESVPAQEGQQQGGQEQSATRTVLHREEAHSQDGGENWTVVSKAELRRP